MGDKRAANLAQLLMNEYGVKVHPSRESGTQTIGVVGSQVVPNNPNRVGLVMINLSANTIYVDINPGVTSSAGILLAPNGGAITLDWRTDFTLVSNDWYAIATLAGSSLRVYSLETL